MTELEIIVGESYFTPGKMVAGIAINGDIIKALEFSGRRI